MSKTPKPETKTPNNWLLIGIIIVLVAGLFLAVGYIIYPFLHQESPTLNQTNNTTANNTTANNTTANNTTANNTTANNTTANRTGINTTPTQSADEVMATSQVVDPETFQRNAGNMIGKNVALTGKIFSINGNTFLIYTEQINGVYMDDVVFVKVNGKIRDTIVNNDLADVYATVEGKTEYPTAAGGINKVPLVIVYPENIRVLGHQQ